MYQLSNAKFVNVRSLGQVLQFNFNEICILPLKQDICTNCEIINKLCFIFTTENGSSIGILCANVVNGGKIIVMVDPAGKTLFSDWSVISLKWLSVRFF